MTALPHAVPSGPDSPPLGGRPMAAHHFTAGGPAAAGREHLAGWISPLRIWSPRRARLSVQAPRGIRRRITARRGLVTFLLTLILAARHTCRSAGSAPDRPPSGHHHIVYDSPCPPRRRFFGSLPRPALPRCTPPPPCSADSEIEIDPSQPAAEQPARLRPFHRSTWRRVYDGIWVAQLEDSQPLRIRRQFVDYLKRSGRRPALARGLFRRRYHWRYGIGPASQRPRTYNTGNRMPPGRQRWEQRVRHHEFMPCAAWGRSLTLPRVGSEPAEFHDWVSYCTPRRARFRPTTCPTETDPSRQVWGLGKSRGVAAAHDRGRIRPDTASTSRSSPSTFPLSGWPRPRGTPRRDVADEGFSASCLRARPGVQVRLALHYSRPGIRRDGASSKPVAGRVCTGRPIVNDQRHCLRAGTTHHRTRLSRRVGHWYREARLAPEYSQPAITLRDALLLPSLRRLHRHSRRSDRPTWRNVKPALALRRGGDR